MLCYVMLRYAYISYLSWLAAILAAQSRAAESPPLFVRAGMQGEQHADGLAISPAAARRASTVYGDGSGVSARDIAAEFILALDSAADPRAQAAHSAASLDGLREPSVSILSQLTEAERHTAEEQMAALLDLRGSYNGDDDLRGVARRALEECLVRAADPEPPLPPPSRRPPPPPPSPPPPEPVRDGLRPEDATAIEEWLRPWRERRVYFEERLRAAEEEEEEEEEACGTARSDRKCSQL